jgi:hypothetical protein
VWAALEKKNRFVQLLQSGDSPAHTKVSFLFAAAVDDLSHRAVDNLRNPSGHSLV